jgi:hypothetical protein
MNNNFLFNLKLLPTVIFFSCIFFVFGQHINAQTSTVPAGEVTSANPYQIATLENLYWLIWDSS